tara:strand:- start:379 stop:1167 length:789 start_codon:yes stop_codon:yes gene_type:complete
MNCKRFARELNAWLAGDHRPESTDVLTRHAETCDSCARHWEPARGLRGLDAPYETSSQQLRAVRQRRKAAFDWAGHSVVRFGSIASPVGRIFVGATDEGLCDVSFRQTSDETYRGWLQKWSAEVWRDDESVSEATDQLEAYFAGRLTRFQLPIDLRQVTPFTEKVLRAVDGIAFGRVSSYGTLARSLGSPGASRAVGGALGRNPVPIVIPCHRVLASGGLLGGFTGGLDTKGALLRLEGHDIPEPTVGLYGTEHPSQHAGPD